jgi:hypothetical protein
VPDVAWNILINVVASGLTGAVVWLAQRSLWHRRQRRRGLFFGLRRGEECLLVVPRHPGSERDHSVNRDDVVVLLELSGLLRECNAVPRVVFHEQATEGLGHRAEFSIGGPTANIRTAAHLRWMMPALTIVPFVRGDPERLTIRIGPDAYRWEPGVFEYAVLAKLAGPTLRRPVFVLCGQTPVANQGAVDYLLSHRRELARAHGLEGSFGLVIRVVNPSVYGRHAVELVQDVTAHILTGGAGGDVTRPGLQEAP